MLINTKSENINDAKLVKPYIHFSRHTLINEQLKQFKIEKLRHYIKKIYDIEISCKLNYSTSNIILKRLLLNISTY